jgi:DNA-binding response OmpR family regulator
MPSEGKQRDSATVLCVVDRRRNPAARFLRDAGFDVLETFTTDQAVALSVSRQIDCVVLDQGFFLETEDWSVAQSLKMVRPNICVLLVSRAVRIGHRLPQGVDGEVSSFEPQQVVEAVRRLLYRDSP